MVKIVPLELVNNAYTLVILGEEFKVVFKIDQSFSNIDPTQTEVLLATYQVLNFRFSTDNHTKCHQCYVSIAGVQSISSCKNTFEFYFNGEKYFFSDK